mmetsp:Transcript_27988/g.46941  ORF Transcript_27988/g.46941 Transcript_27988/m.46941 type:complete len:439 (+) Transcript_27988:46-1362(+)
MGGSTSKLEKALGNSFPEDERYFGLENFGNTCYCNSVLQALYFCQPFRKNVVHYYYEHELPAGPDPSGTSDDGNLLFTLGELFASISCAKKKTGVFAPRKFVTKVKKENELFRSYMHQDAHEFLNYLLNDIDETLRKESKQKLEQQKAAPLVSSVNTPSTPSSKRNGFIKHAPAQSDDEEDEDDRDGLLERKPNGRSTANGGGGGGFKGGASIRASLPLALESKSKDNDQNMRTWIQDVFQGTMTNETKCLCCESVTNRDETFLDLSLDIEQNTSISACMRNFSSTETLNDVDKFFCDTCCSLQEAQKRIRVKKLPKILALHLKRFKFIEQLGRYKKLSYRVVFPLELKMCNTTDTAEDPDREYHLYAVVVHVGSRSEHGHYISIVRSHNHWLVFDDDNVELIEEQNVQTVFGSLQDGQQSTDVGYILFYTSADIQLL